MKGYFLTLFLLLILALPGSAQPAAEPARQRFEYCSIEHYYSEEEGKSWLHLVRSDGSVEDVKATPSIVLLNRLAAQGWELVTSDLVQGYSNHGTSVNWYWEFKVLYLKRSS